MIDPKHFRWRRASGLQKVIRRCNPDLAAQIAVDLVASAGEFYARHRLSICCLEDAFASPTAACQTVLDCRDSRFTVSDLARRIAELPKCRICDDLLISRRTAETQANLIQINDLPVPDVVAQVADISAKSLEGFPPVLRAATAIIAESDGELVNEPLPEFPLIAGLPGATFDWHCQEGRRSFAYYAKAADGAREFFLQYPTLDKLKALGLVVFEVEGGACLNRLTSPQIEEVRCHAFLSYSLGWARLSRDQFDELAQIVRDSLPILHRSRERVVTAIDQEAEERASRDSVPEPLL